MVQYPFPDPEYDGEEPDRSVPPAAAGTGPDASDTGEDPVQGLFVCLPAEDLDVTRFAQHGESDSMPPGPLLAEVVHALTGEDGGGLASLSDDQLVGIIAAARRMESRAAWTQLAALREFAARRHGGQKAGQAREFAADELACGLNLTWQSAAGQIDYACAVADRLPRTFAALAEGRIHPVHLRIIEDETRILSDQDAAAADEKLAQRAGPLTFGQLRALAHRVVLKLDPEAARKRKEAARREAHVRRFREGSGNAGMVARELPPMRCSPPGSTWSSGRWTCAPAACPAPCKSCACAPTLTCSKSGTAAPSPPAHARTPTRAKASPQRKAATRARAATWTEMGIQTTQAEMRVRVARATRTGPAVASPRTTREAAAGPARLVAARPPGRTQARAWRRW